MSSPDPVSTATVEAVRALAAGPVSDLPAAVALLDSVEPASLEPLDQVDLVRAIDRCEAALAAVKVTAIATVADSYVEAGMVASEARHEIGAALRLAPVTAADRTTVALDLRDRFPRTLRLLSDGLISWAHAANLVRGTQALGDDTAGQVEDAVLARLPRLTPAETRRAVADAVVRLDPAAAIARARRARADRRIERLPGRDGRTGWYLPMDLDQEGSAWARATHLATQVAAARAAAGLDDPGLDALRVDVVIDQILGNDPLADLSTVPTTGSTGTGSSTGPVPGDPSGADLGARVPRCSCGGKQVAAVVIDLDTLVGLADNPGTVPGYGLVPADLARAMATDRDWVRWTVDPDTGQLLDVGADTYQPSPRLQRFIRARDQRCGFPGCGRRAETCDLDHARTFSPAPGGGKTVRANLGPLCRQHHNAKTHGGWRLTPDPRTGTKTWTSPLGHTYLTQAVPLRT